jgi:hypothetical protein
MRNILLIISGLSFAFGLSFSPAAFPREKVAGKKKVEYRKTQEVNFDGSDIDGQVRSPDGAYLLQKRGVKFIPLYKVDNQFEKKILESVEYLR